MEKRLIPFAVMALAMASCSSDDVVDVNPDPSGDALSFSIAVGHSRATETKLDNLGDFNVVAKGVHPHGGIYTNFLIGEVGTDGNVSGETASREGTSGNTWSLDRNVYWPTSVDKALFWAWTCSQTKNGTTSSVLPSGSFSFDNENKMLKVTDFIPRKAELKSGDDAGYWNDGANQVDFVTAFTEATRSSSVSLQFNHVLSQISIKAKSDNKKETDHRLVRIKGAWLVNTADKATLKSTYEWSATADETTGKQASHTLTWENASKTGDYTAYGSFYKTPKVLQYGSAGEIDLFGENGESLMLIPQTIEAWKNTGTDKDLENNANNAYILLLCRVELKHPGTNHTGSDADDDDIKSYDGNHYHQMFPVNTTKKFVEDEYGFVCVPVGATFDSGKKYTFTLDICGEHSGAGYYPPCDDFTALIPDVKAFTSTWNTNCTLSIVNRPGGKNKGDLVLDEPIKFEVTVSPWDNNTGWTDGNVKLD